MSVWIDLVRCPKCGKLSMERETWLSTKDFHAECGDCGYFQEVSHGYSVAFELGIGLPEYPYVRDYDKLLAALRQLHFDTDVYPCSREGFVRKDEKDKGECLIAGTWFLSPSDLTGVEVDWIEPGSKGDDNLPSEEQQIQIKRFIRDYYADVKIKTIYFFRGEVLEEKSGAALFDVLLVTPNPEESMSKGERTTASLERALAERFGLPVNVSVRKAIPTNGIRLDLGTSWKDAEDRNAASDDTIDLAGASPN